LNITVLDAGTLGDGVDLAQLAQLGRLTVHPATSHEQIAGRIRDAHVVLTNKVPLDAASLGESNSLELIVVMASIADKLDLEAAARQGVEVRTVQGYATESVAQFTIALMLSLACRLGSYTDVVSSGQYSEQLHFSHVGAGFTELAGKQVGIIGLGRIGSRVADVVRALGADVAYFSTRQREAPGTRMSLRTLLMTSDVVSIHAPRTAATENLIDMSALRLMKEGAFLLNVGRGGIVNEHDLVDALSSGVIAGAALDVYDVEPLAADSPLLASPRPRNLILTPHSAWGGDGAQAALVDRANGIVAEHVQGRARRRQAGHD